MDLTFKDLKNKIIVDYLDDLMLLYKKRENHFLDLERFLHRCRDFYINLNPKKLVFIVTEGKILGHIVSRDEIKIDLERVKEIQQLSLPTS